MPLLTPIEDLLTTKPTPVGQLQPGNVNLGNRPRVKNADGSISTVRSVSFNVDGKEVLMPTVSDAGKVLSNEEALAMYQASGKHLGVFDTPENATAYAKALHEQQAVDYAEPESPGFLSTAAAALRQQSSVTTLYERGVNEHSLPFQSNFDIAPQEGYDPYPELQQSEFSDDPRALAVLMRAESPEGLQFLKERIRQEQRDRQTIGAAGGWGIASDRKSVV